LRQYNGRTVSRELGQYPQVGGGRCCAINQRIGRGAGRKVRRRRAGIPFVLSGVARGSVATSFVAVRRPSETAFFPPPIPSPIGQSVCHLGAPPCRRALSASTAVAAMRFVVAALRSPSTRVSRFVGVICLLFVLHSADAQGYGKRNFFFRSIVTHDPKSNLTPPFHTNKNATENKSRPFFSRGDRDLTITSTLVLTVSLSQSSRKSRYGWPTSVTRQAIAGLFVAVSARLALGD
jgi:hypothetical protein